MRTRIYVSLVFLLVLLTGNCSEAQVTAVKSWHGYYPEMDGSYPLSFIAFKGWLIPVPHVFVRSYPTYYYVEADATPVSDSEGYTDLLRIDFLKIAARVIEKTQMKNREDETSGIKNNTEYRYEIGKKLFDAQSDCLPDIYDIASGFVRLYTCINRLNSLEDCGWLEQEYEKEADGLLTRFLGINLLQTGHGAKLDAFSAIRTELNRQTGETDYVFRKVYYYRFYNASDSRSYAFLAN